MDYQNIVFFLNRRCTVGCRSCNVSAAPARQRELSPEWLDSFFHRVEDLNFAGYITWTGGEPFLSFPSLKRGLGLAATLGLKSEILTSGTWFRHNTRFLDEIAGIAGISLRVSVDAEHQRKVPVEELVRLLHRADQMQIETNLTLREIPGEPDALNGTLAALEEALPRFMGKNKDQSRFCHRIPHMPVCDPRRAASTSRPANNGSKKWQKPCTLAFRDLVVGEDGVVYPCCGVIGFQQRHIFAVGDPLILTWKELLPLRDKHPLLSRLRNEGPYRLAVAQGLSPEEWGIPFTSPCHLCLTLLNYCPEVL